MLGSTVLAGALGGKAAFEALLSELSAEPGEPETVFVDFAHVEVATASFLRESVLALRDYLRSRRSNHYPIVANANSVVLEELVELLRPRGDAVMTCSLDARNEVSALVPIGILDPKQRQTFELVLKHGETDAGTLMRLYGESEGTKHTTAWNNRLASLATLGLVIEQANGRAKRYRPLLARAA